MNIDVNQYRACIGSFNLIAWVTVKPTKKKYKCQKRPTNNSTKGPYIALQVFHIYLFIVTFTSMGCYGNKKSTSSVMFFDSIHTVSKENNLISYIYKQSKVFSKRLLLIVLVEPSFGLGFDNIDNQTHIDNQTNKLH